MTDQYIPLRLCKASSPSLCSYHSVLTKMLLAKEELARVGMDEQVLEKYYDARRTLDLLEHSGWVEVADTPTQSVDTPFKTKLVQKLIKQYPLYKFVSDLASTTIYDTYVRPPYTNELTVDQHFVELPPLGRVLLVDAVWGDEDSPDDNIWLVFEIAGRKFRIDGSYSSWDGSKWFDEVEEVQGYRQVKTTIRTEYLPLSLIEQL